MICSIALYGREIISGSPRVCKHFHDGRDEATRTTRTNAMMTIDIIIIITISSAL